jgi:hypothetical protein
MSESGTRRSWPFWFTRRDSGTISRRRRAARQTTPLRLEHLESRSLLSALPPADLVSWYRAEGDAQDFADGNHGVLVNGAAFAAGLWSTEVLPSQQTLASKRNFKKRERGTRRKSVSQAKSLADALGYYSCPSSISI